MPWFQNNEVMWFANDDNTILMSGPYPVGSVNVSSNFRNEYQPPGGDQNNKFGGFTPQDTPSNEPGGYRQGGSDVASRTAGGEQIYDTRSGPLTADELERRLRLSFYPGPWDPASMVAAYNRAPGGAGSGSSGNAGSSGSGSSGSGSGSFPTAGGLGQLEYDIALRNQELLNRRLKELDIPGLNLQRRSQLFAEINALRGQTGYINPEREARMIPGYTSPVEEGGYGYTPYPWTVYDPRAVKAETPPGATPGATPAALTDDEALDWIWDFRPDLRANAESTNGTFGDLGVPSNRRSYVRTWIRHNDKDKSPQQSAADMGWKPPSGAPPAPPANTPPIDMNPIFFPTPNPVPGRGWLPDMPPEAPGEWPNDPTGDVPPNPGWPRVPGGVPPNDPWAQMRAAWQTRR